MDSNHSKHVEENTYPPQFDGHFSLAHEEKTAQMGDFEVGILTPALDEGPNINVTKEVSLDGDLDGLEESPFAGDAKEELNLMWVAMEENEDMDMDMDMDMGGSDMGAELQEVKEEEEDKVDMSFKDVMERAMEKQGNVDMASAMVSPHIMSIKHELEGTSEGFQLPLGRQPPQGGAGEASLWVKWRGKWQAGIQCSMEDCPYSTIKAIPTCGRKKYIVVFFPSARSFVWTDLQLVRPITDNPEPLAFGSHEKGRASVKYLNAAQRHMMRRLIAAMLDISDCLPLQAVVERARDVNIWKEFAKEAALAVTYPELGVMLVKLQGMILPLYLNKTWLSDCFEAWKQQSETASTAGCLEISIKELKSAVCWDDVSKMWDQTEQTNLESDWKNWKEEAQRSRKNIVRSNQMLTLSTAFVGMDNTGLKCSTEGQSNEDKKSQRRSDLKAEPKMETAHIEGRKSNMPPVRCAAFSLKKGRQCNKFVSDGAIYCCKHEPTVNSHEQKQKRPLPTRTSGVDSPICLGMTKYGRRCTHKAKDGSTFCLKHLLQDAAECSEALGMKNDSMQLAISPISSNRIDVILDAAAAQDLRSGKVIGSSSRKRKHGSDSEGHHGNSRQEAVKVVNRTAQRGSNWIRCIGWCKGSGDQCSHRAKPGFSHCEKHLPGSFGYGGKNQEKYASKEVFQAGLLGSSNHVDGKNVIRARDLLHEYMKACLPEGAGKEWQQSRQKVKDWILSEASKDIGAAEALYTLVTAEKGSLEKILSEDTTAKVSNAIVPYIPNPIVRAAQYIPDPIQHAGPSVSKLGNPGIEQPLSSACVSSPTGPSCKFKKQMFHCKLCIQEFINLDSLSHHWRSCHRKEAHQLFRGYACLHCGSPFTNKKGLERHWNVQHSGTPFLSDSLLVALCIICSGQFADFEDLWQHALYSHSDFLALAAASIRQESACLTSEDSSKLKDANGILSSNGNQPFASSDLQQDAKLQKQAVNVAGGLQQGVSRPVSSDSPNKFRCKICGMRFRLLPDLGRHHQAEHKPAQAVRLKAGKTEGIAMGLSGEPSSNKIIEREKNRAQKLDVRRANRNLQLDTEVKNSQQKQYDQDVADIEGYKEPKVPGCPSNKDILAVARVSCCKNKLLSILDRKYVMLPERLSLKAAKLCSEANVRLQWHREGYTCPNGCRDYMPSSEIKPVILPSSFPRANFVPFQPPVLTVAERSKSGNILWDEKQVHTAPVQRTHEMVAVLCEDISFGKEAVPIPCIVDLNVLKPCNCSECIDDCSNRVESLRPWENFSYVTKRLLDPSLGLDTKSSQLGCMCKESQCLPERCDHVYLFDNDNNDALDIYGQPMRGRFPYDKHGCIILEEGFLVYECNAICNCQDSCQNRVLQKGVRVQLEVYKTKHKGWAVRAAQPITRGTFVCEYIGEVLDDQEANKRGERYDKEGCSYLYDIDAHIGSDLLGRTKPFVIDATRFGNVARFINHSCEPNLVNYQVLVESMDCQLAHIGLYASRDIDVGEELAYDYRYKLLPGKGCPCHCGAKNCRGRLY